MIKYILRRLCIALIVLLGITILDFGIMTLIGNPIELMSGGPKVSSAMLAHRAESMGLNDPIYVQYWNWLTAVLHGDFGYSYADYLPVGDKIASHIGPTLILTGSALALSLVISIVGGIYSATHTHQTSDYVVVTSSFLGQSVPSFFLALVLIYVFSVQLGWLPSNGMRELGTSGSGVDVRYLILPCITLAVSMAGRNIRYIRGAMLEILNKDYLRTAAARGIGRRRVIWRHALKNALIPILTVIGMEIPGLFGGSIVIEQVYSWPGLGLLTMNAVLTRDYPMIMAVCLLSAVVVLTANLVTDILYAVVDPTVRLGRREA